MVKKEKVKIGKTIKITAGGNHKWVEATIGGVPVKLRKPR